MIMRILEIFLDQVFNLWLYIFFVLVFSIAAHEFGHYVYLKWILKRDVEFNNRVPSISFNADGLNKVDTFNIYSFGICFGLFPLLILPYPQFIIALVLYLFGCKHDIKKIWRLK